MIPVVLFEDEARAPADETLPKGMNPTNLSFPILLIIVFVSSTVGFHLKSFLNPVIIGDFNGRIGFHFLLILYYGIVHPNCFTSLPLIVTPEAAKSFSS